MKNEQNTTIATWPTRRGSKLLRRAPATSLNSLKENGPAFDTLVASFRQTAGPRAGCGTLAISLATIALFSLGCGSVPSKDASRALDRRIELSQLDVVDCIVEGAVRQMGRNFVYQEPPRMARMTEFECASLGGTFVAFDPTEPNAVVERWLPFAEAGDVEAQHRLGLLYEGLLGADPDYEKAARWYGEAVEQGHRESMYALSVLYEKGLGVDPDIVRALDLYRQASGLGADSLMLSSEAYREIDAARASLATEISELEVQRSLLEEQVAMLKTAERAEDEDSRARIVALESLADQLRSQLTQKESRVASLPAYRLIDRADRRRPRTFDFPELPAGVMRSQSMGSYYALVIGNNDYEQLPDLETPHNDAQRISELLTERFGFSTQLLLDANEEDIKRAIYDLGQAAGETDNLLIYFAGHGELRDEADRSRLRGYWLPTNADEDQDVNWVDNWWVTSHLDNAAARRVLVIADSCYGGVFSTDLPIGPVTRLPPLSERDFNRKIERKSRFVLASGGNAPVLDKEGPTASHSVFARAFIEILDGASGPISIIELYGRVFDLMYERLSAVGLNQEPELRVIRAAGHQSEGDFYFVSGESPAR